MVIRSLARHLKLLIGYGLLFSVLGGLSAYIYLMTRFTVEPWHTEELQEEYTVAKSGEIADFDAYLELENRLYRELRERVYAPPGERGQAFQRFTVGSRTDPTGFEVNWNRSYELSVEKPRGGVLMLHGLSDSPYSLRNLAEMLHAEGFWVTGLRVPGHGTAPSGLVHAVWEDWAAAVRLGALHVRECIGLDAPLYIMGYSNGAALAVEYTISQLEGEKIPKPDVLILLSPAIAVGKVAALARVQSWLAELPGLEKLHWESVMPEFDPYKYNSFAVNAGAQIYDLTRRIPARLTALKTSGRLGDFPRLLAFQSVVDATIPAGSIVDKLLRQLPAGDREVVFFDVNRRARANDMLLADPKALTVDLLKEPALTFGVTVVRNVSETTDEVQALRRKPGESVVETIPLALAWPRGVYSLSHIALPFPADDPLYGVSPPPDSKVVNLGGVELRGERGVLSVPPEHFLRLRYNPFYSYLATRVKSFVGADGGISE